MQWFTMTPQTQNYLIDTLNQRKEYDALQNVVQNYRNAPIETLFAALGTSGRFAPVAQALINMRKNQDVGNAMSKALGGDSGIPEALKGYFNALNTPWTNPATTMNIANALLQIAGAASGYNTVVPGQNGEMSVDKTQLDSNVRKYGASAMNSAGKYRTLIPIHNNQDERMLDKLLQFYGKKQESENRIAMLQFLANIALSKLFYANQLGRIKQLADAGLLSPEQLAELIGSDYSIMLDPWAYRYLTGQDFGNTVNIEDLFGQSNKNKGKSKSKSNTIQFMTTPPDNTRR